MKQEKAAEPIDLKKFPFPKLSKVDIVFATMSADPALLDEAKRRGFYNGHTPANRMFSDLFYSGGKINFRKDVDPEFLNAAYPYCRALMGSFEPKHEHKEAICAMLLAELVESVEPKEKAA